ncbi:MAG: hypothetical protein IT371_12395 [Deltaproteobacteria bacterium]|nr:hypothetical protein [Deltaproteobacteria bacterium]
MDRLCQLALGPALEAAAAAPPTIVPPARRGLVFGTAMGSHSVNERYYRGLLAEGAAGASPALFAYTLPSTPAAELSIQLGLEGPLVTLALGTGAGLQALGEAAVLLEGGAADWMLAGGAEALGETLLRAWLGVETPLAEGAAFAVLSRVADGAWARVAGHARAFGPDAGERAVSAVLARAGLRAAELGTRIDPGSACDRQSLRVFGESLAARPLLALSCCLESVACLPLLVVAEDPSGLVDALCLTAP